jgi:predicted CoA-binding protein
MNVANSKRVVVLGASANPARMSYQAVKELREAGHEVLPVHPALSSLLGADVLTDLEEVRGEVDTLTLYVNSTRSAGLADKILNLSAKRVIFNPGAENAELMKKLEAAGVECLEACTLVMLRTGDF